MKIFVFPGCSVPVKGFSAGGKPDEDNVGFDVTARGVVALRQWVPERPYERQLIFDFRSLPTRPFTDSTPHAGLTYVPQPGKPNSLRFTMRAMLYFGCGFVLDMPKGMHALIVSRGSTIERGLEIKNESSPIDRGFCAEPVMAIHNWSSWFVELGANDLTLGQLIFPGFPNVNLVQVASFGDIERKPRGNGSHGSTDKHKKR